ncbi:hypothetical protein Hdeb2414_s0007g00230911 [Helianthus debilis subsp. tardiflorus]
MERGDLELGNTDVTQKCLQSFIKRVENEVKNTKSPSICMVSHVLRNLSPTSFNPQVVSIGPLHRENKNVKAFEGRKVSYLSKLLGRFDDSNENENILGLCIGKVYASLEQIKACYVWKKTYNDVKIVEMMVMDACFILEFLGYDQDSENILQDNLVKSDLLLLENQIPFFILNDIFECTISKYEKSYSLIDLLHPLLAEHNIFVKPICTNHISINTTHHILSLLRECYKPTDNTQFETSHVDDSDNTQSEISAQSKISNVHDLIIPSIVDLDRAGVSFKPIKHPAWPMQMKVDLNPCFFWSWTKPTLRMPVLKIQDSTVSILRNLIAYEQLCETNSHITSYAAAINMLVDTQEDVAKLIDSKVLINFMGSNEEATNMINNIGKHVVWDSFYYGHEWKTLNEHCNGYWSTQIVKLKRTYFSSPWNVIALLAGIILFVLTAIQTFFTIKPVGSNN